MNPPFHDDQEIEVEMRVSIILKLSSTSSNAEFNTKPTVPFPQWIRLINIYYDYKSAKQRLEQFNYYRTIGKMFHFFVAKPPRRNSKQFFCSTCQSSIASQHCNPNSIYKSSHSSLPNKSPSHSVLFPSNIT